MGRDDTLQKIRAALRLESSEGEERTDLREDVGDVYLDTDQFDQALLYFRKIRDSGRWRLLDNRGRARIWYKMARAHDGRGELEAALRLSRQAEKSIAGDEEDPRLLGKVYSLAARVSRKLGDHRAALAYSLRALFLLRFSPENEEIAAVQLTAGSTFLRQGDFREAVRYFQDALSTYRRIDDPQGKAKAQNNLGVAYKNLCQWNNATTALRHALRIDKEYGNYSGVALRSLNIGIIHYHRGEWHAATEKIEKSLHMSRAVGDALGISRSSLALARLARHQRRWDEAKEYAGEALRLSSEQGNRREAAAAHEEMGAWYFDRGQYETARSFYRKALSFAMTISDRNDHIVEVTRRLSELESEAGSPGEGEKLARESLRMAIAMRDKRLVGLAFRALALACRKGGDFKKASRYAGRSVRLLDAIGIPFELARSLVEKASISVVLDDIGSARSDLTRAEGLFPRFFADRYSCRVLIEFARLKIRADRVEDALVLLHKAERFLEKGRITEEEGEIEKLRRRVEARFVECSRGSSNRFLLLGEARPGLTRSLDGLLGPLAADGGFLFAKSGSEWKILDRRNLDASEAIAVLADADRVWKREGGARPAIFLSGGRADGLRSRMIVPGDGEESPGVYVERILSSDKPLFTRRDLNFLVGVSALLAPAAGPPAAPKSGQAPPPGGTCRFGGVVTASPRMLDILDMLRKLSGSHVTILIQGETGTGKGLLAYEISRGYPGPFVTINCADITETILESELFGHVKSAFTGAHSSKKGLFEVADGGTVFIDEIDKTSRKFQEKLLRVVDRQEFKPVGSVHVKKVDCRIVCASNRDLGERVREGRFLADLFYRLKVISIHLPPLRERREDIPLLAEHFLQRFLDRLGKSDIELSDDVIELLSRYDWPGNVRDLENEIERAVALASPGEIIGVDSFSDEVTSSRRELPAIPVAGEKPLADVVAEVEGEMIRDALERCGGNKSMAARLLGLTRKGLRNKIRRYRIET